MSMKPLVLYHANCWDGFCAAWIARKALGEIEAVPVQYGQDPPDVVGRPVFVLDFSYPRMLMQALIRYAASVVVLDHHKTAKDELDGLDGYCGATIRFDLDKSGGRLAWDFFFGNKYATKYTPESCEQLRPWLVDYTEDRDLWRWKLPKSREVNAALRSYPLDYALWDRWHEDGFNVMLLAPEGEAILRREQQIIDEHVKHAREIEMDGYKILSVNATVLFSDIAGELAASPCGRCEGDGKAHGSDRPFEYSGPGSYPGPCPVCSGSGKRPFGACWFERQDGKRQWSLRSREGGVDVSEVAKRRGGGGHKNAAGFEE